MSGKAADVIIVGGGPAGSACAITLARRGLDVLTIERAVFPRSKACGEYLNAGAVRLLDALGVGGSLRERAASVHSLRMQDRQGSALTLAFCAESLSFPRSQLDALLSAEASKAGSRTVRGRVEGVEFDGSRASGVVYRDESGERRPLHARFIVGADGARSLVARSLGLARPFRGRERFAIGGHFRGLRAGLGTLDMFVDGSSYLAVNPLGDGQCNVMLVVSKDDLKRARLDLDGFAELRSHELAGGAFDGAFRSGTRIGFGPLASFAGTAWAPGAVLAGDAAGMIDPFTGQGVFIALRSGIAAAGAIVRALDAPQSEAKSLASYARVHGRELALRRTACLMVKTLIGTPALARRAAPRLARSPERIRSVFEAVSGVGAIERAFDPRALSLLVA